MSIAQAISMPARGGSRWLLFASLALNLFFVGVALAMVIRGPAPPRRWDPNVFVRIERFASTLPAADADLLRNAMKTNHDAIEAAQAKYHTARTHIHDALREDPFKIEDLNAAMAETRTARQDYDQVIQGVFADVAASMSSAGRHAAADWRRPRTARKAQ
jgi:uncharacterized membrane protein